MWQGPATHDAEIRFRAAGGRSLSYSGYIGIMEKRMETTIVYWGYIGDNGEEHGNYF